MPHLRFVVGFVGGEDTRNKFTHGGDTCSLSNQDVIGGWVLFGHELQVRAGDAGFSDSPLDD
ncbi:hypothetical protein ACHAWF_004709 [Thalassiosira exigua]